MVNRGTSLTKMTFSILPRRLFVFAFAAIIVVIQAEVYHDFQEFESSETLKYGIFLVESNIDWLNVTDNSKRFPKINSFWLYLNSKGVAEAFCKHHKIYLKNKQVYLMVDKDSLRNLAECFNNSRPSVDDLSRFSLLAYSETYDFQLKHIKLLQSLGIRFGLQYSGVTGLKTKLQELQAMGVNVEVIIVTADRNGEDEYIYDYNSFVEHFNEQYSLLTKSIATYEAQLILHEYRGRYARYTYRWGEATKRFVMAQESSNCREKFKDELDTFICQKEKIFKRYTDQKPSISVEATKVTSNSTGSLLETSLVCNYFDSIFLEFNGINEEALSRLASVHSNLPCKITWNVRWHMKKTIKADKDTIQIQNNSNLKILADVAKKYPGLVKTLFVLLPHIVIGNTTVDNGISMVKETLEMISSTLTNIPLKLLEYVRTESVIHSKQEQIFDYREVLNASVGALIDFAGSSLRPELLVRLADKYIKDNTNTILISYSSENFRKQKFDSCVKQKKQWNILKTWAGVNAFHIVVESSLSSYSQESMTSWLKDTSLFGNDFKPETATPEELVFLSDLEDKCVALPESVPSTPVRFNVTAAGISLNLTSEKYSKLRTDEIAELILLVHYKFNAIEIVPKHHSIQDFKDVIQRVREFANSSDFAQFKYFISIEPRHLDYLDSYEEFEGIHINLCFCESENDLVNLERLQNSSVKRVGISLPYEDAMNPNHHERWINHSMIADYVVISVNLAEALLGGPDSIVNDSSQSLNKTIRDYIKHNPQDIPPNPVFDNLRAIQFNIKRWNPDATVYMKISWPTVQNTRSTERTQKIWEFLNDFSNVFNFPFFINEAFDSSVQRCTDRSDPQYGWWKLTSEYDVGNSENYVDKQAEYYDMETLRPIGFRKNVTQNSTSESLPLTEIVSGASAFLLLVILVAAVLIYRLRSELQMMLTKEELREFEMGRRGSDCDDPQSNDYCSIAYNKEKYEISKAAFKLDPSLVIGSGNFGLVYKASLPKHDKPVAVKVPKICGKVELLSVLREIKLISYVGEHENILKLVGAYTREVQKGIVYVITEYAEHGSLLEYLRKIPNTEREKEGLLLQLNQFCLDISKGMHYLSEKKVVHGDLSARNVLLDSCNVCKISDFGLSRKLYYLDIYVKQTSEPVPWKWMAIEALERSELSLKSDIWSLGVTFWEIYSFAKEPYQCVSWDLEFSKKLMNGLRLPKPEVADQTIYEVMLSCWKIDPDERPNTDYFIGFFQSLRSLSYTNL